MSQKIIFFLLLISFLTVKAQVYFPKNDGVSQNYKNYVAFVNATIYASSDQKLEKATLIIKENKIINLGIGIVIPKEAIIIDVSEKFIYPSFIDLYTEFGILKPITLKSETLTPQYDTKRDGYYWNDHVKPEYNAYENLSYDSTQATILRENGFGTVVSHFNDGIVAGTGVLWTLNDNTSNANRIIDQKISQHFTFKKSNQSKQEYPTSLMGSMALIRQVFNDAKWYLSGGSSTKDISLEAFNTNNSLVKIINAGDKYNSLRADKIAKEFDISFVIKGKGNEFESLDAIKKTGASFIIPINFPEPYDVSNKYISEQVSLSDMKYWNQAPNNLKLLDQNNISFAITTADLKDPKIFLINLRKAVQQGFPKQKALLALTETPARLINKTNTIGTLAKDKLANFIITNGDLFDPKTTIQQNWIQGIPYTTEKNNQNDIRGNYELQFENQKYELVIEGETNKLEAKTINNNKKYNTKIDYNEPWLYINIKDQDTLKPAYARLSTMYINGKFLNSKIVNKEGVETNFNISKKDGIIPKTKDLKSEKKTIMYPVTFPNIAFGNSNLPKQEDFLIKNVMVWTGEKEGNLPEMDVVIKNGKIFKIGKNISLTNVTIIDGTGKHLTAGIIDEHSHIAISNGVNESGQNCSAEVSIEDVVNPEDINIYRNLSGGVTTSNLLHGSANPIGGRAALIKLKWGYSAEEMLVKSNPKYIKFALGENVKQANWGENSKNRFPQTRMGVEQVFEDYFTKAIAYKKEWNDYESNNSKGKIIPRLDTELEVLNEILEKKRFITCHSYVQSEINMLIKLADKYKFKIQTFTHILEGYKLADKMKTHGVSGSTFSDWWSYKFEVKDAIPYNAALMHSQGVCVSINSDDAEMSRRLNQEAAKTIKYGEVSEIEAWNFVTLNPAKILQIADKVGSIKIGKDADLVLWSDNPLSIYAKVEKTIIEGILFYDLEKQILKTEIIQKEKAALINDLLFAKNEGQKTQIPTIKPSGHYHCDTIGEHCQELHYKN